MKRKLEIGPEIGKRIDSSWETLDIVPGKNIDIVADISEHLDMIKDNTYDLIYASHILEHIPWFKTVSVLKEIYRILKPKGILEIWVPDFKKIVEVYLNKKIPDGWNMLNSEKDPYLWINGRLFAYDREGTNQNIWHKATFDSIHLKSCLKKSGFIDITFLQKPRGHDHGWINLGMCGKKLSKSNL